MDEISPFDIESLLAIEVGSINTRAALLDTVEGHYRFLASGVAPSTVTAPMLDAGEGVRNALERLSSVSGRQFISDEEGIILPSESESVGVDRLVATLSAGEPLRVVAAGLLEDVSIKSVRRLVSTVNAKILDTISLSDTRRSESQIDSILRLRPEVIIIAGGTNNGATRSLLKLINTLGLAINMLPANHRPEVLFAGNKNVADSVTTFLGELTSLSVVPNIRPDLEIENLGPAESRLIEIYRKIHGKKILGIDELEIWSNGNLLPTSTGFGRVIQFLNRVYEQHKGVLGIDIGSSLTTVASSFGGNLNLRTFPDLGIGAGLVGLLNSTKIEDIVRWIPYAVSDDQVVDYLYNKSIYPASLPATPEDLSIEHALAREVIRNALNQAKSDFPMKAPGPSRGGLLPWFEPIMVGGSVITKAPSMAQSLLMILDSIQPTGISRVILDNNNLAPALGTAAGVNVMLAVQVLESGAFFNLGTVISPIGKARRGVPILRLTIQYSDGNENTMEIQNGSLQSIPLPPGQTAQLHLQPLHRFDVGMGGSGKSGRLRVVGGYFGIVIDARGRPIEIPDSPEKRRETLIRWQRSLKG